MQGDQKRLNHPLISYVSGVLIMVFILFVIIGIIHHLTISPYGPGLLRPYLKKYQKERESPILIEAMRHEEMELHRHFHIEVDSPVIPEDKRSVCYICHSDFPHKRNKKVRSLMNMHTQYFKCESCHIKEKPGVEIVYKWYSPIEDKPKGPFLGTDFDPITETLIVGNRYAKITPYIRREITDDLSQKSNKTGNLKLAIQMQDAPLAVDFMRVRDSLTPEQRDGVKNKFHENIKPKGFDCKTCHTEKSILNLKELGFSEKRIASLTTTELIGIITKYDDFYFPEILKER